MTDGETMSKFIKRKFDGEKKGFFQTFEINLYLLNIILIFLIVATSLTYLFYVNRQATSGFEIKSLERKITELEQQTKKLELQKAELQSLSAIEKSTVELGMVDSPKIDYLPAVGSAFAVK